MSLVTISSNGAEVGAALRLLSAGIRPAVERAVDASAQIMVTYVRANASGRPGPRVITGNYRRSWGVRNPSPSSVGPIERLVGTDAPQGWRLEKGFVGIDALGRHYNQPPFPHVGPAADRMTTELPAAIISALTPLLGAQ